MHSIHPATAAPLSRSSADAWRGWWLGLLGVVIFALTIPMTRLASGSAADPQLPPVFVAIGRAAVAGVLAVAWLAWRRAAWPRPQQWRRLALTACGVVLGFPLLMGLAVVRVEGAHAAVVTGLLPMATAALAAWMLRQRAGLGFWLSAFTGTVLVIGYAAWKSDGGVQWADGLLLAAVAAGAWGYVQGARLSVGGPGVAMPPAEVISWVLVMALPFTLPVAIAQWPVTSVRPAAWGGFAYVAVFSMWLGFFAWYRGLALGGTLGVSQVQLAQPFLSMAFAVPLLGERLDAGTVAFALAVMATVFLSRRWATRPPAASAKMSPAHLLTKEAP
jgi:drug/metabolite transporter (DMT)-like permease